MAIKTWKQIDELQPRWWADDLLIHNSSKEYKQVSTIIKNFNYKTGFLLRFRLFKNNSGYLIHLWASLPVEHSITGKKGKVNNVQYKALTNLTDEDKIVEIVKEIIVDMEMHEIDEFLKYKGNYVKNPHPELNKQ